MKSTLVDNKEEKEIKYPCLMTTHGDLGAIVVLFHDHCCGVVVYSRWQLKPVGYYTETWVMSKFTPFDGTIILSND